MAGDQAQRCAVFECYNLSGSDIGLLWGRMYLSAEITFGVCNEYILRQRCARKRLRGMDPGGDHQCDAPCLCLEVMAPEQCLPCVVRNS
jgi:hypothetical protein